MKAAVGNSVVNGLVEQMDAHWRAEIERFYEKASDHDLLGQIARQYDLLQLSTAVLKLAKDISSNVGSPIQGARISKSEGQISTVLRSAEDRGRASVTAMYLASDHG